MRESHELQKWGGSPTRLRKGGWGRMKSTKHREPYMREWTEATLVIVMVKMVLDSSRLIIRGGGRGQVREEMTPYPYTRVRREVGAKPQPPRAPQG